MNNYLPLEFTGSYLPEANLEDIRSKPNIIIFGSSGTGKSSLINMIIGDRIAETSDRSIGCTMDSSCYSFEKVNVWDTAGLNEGEKHSAVVSTSAISKLWRLMTNCSGGIILIIMTMIPPRVIDSTKINYDIFSRKLLPEVPCILVVTKCERSGPDDKLNDWKLKNYHDIINSLENVKDIVCVCTKFPIGSFPNIIEDYIFSRRLIDISILNNKLNHPFVPNNVMSFILSFLKRMINYIVSFVTDTDIFALSTELYEIMRKLGLSDSEAKRLSNDVVLGHEEN
jgi:GTPase SAR1 family protein